MAKPKARSGLKAAVFVFALGAFFGLLVSIADEFLVSSNGQTSPPIALLAWFSDGVKVMVPIRTDGKDLPFLSVPWFLLMISCGTNVLVYGLGPALIALVFAPLLGERQEA